MDREHNINREEMRQSYESLDNIYHVSEKKELKKMREVGITSQQFYDRKDLEMTKEQETEGT